MLNDIIWMDILALDVRVKRKLHLDTEDIELTQEDIEMINKKKYVNLKKLKEMLERSGFTNYAIENEIGISKAMYSMVFGKEDRKNKRGLRMRTVVAMLNAIRRRKVYDSFEEILTDEEINVLN